MLNWIEVNAQALRQNYELLSRRSGEAALAPVLKSNAYGHGLAIVYEALKPLNPAWLCVNYVEEAQELRDLGFKGRVLVVGPASPELMSKAAHIQSDLVVGNFQMLGHALKHQTLKIHLKFDTGMGRQGFSVDDVEKVIGELGSAKSQVEGVCSHFANVEDVTEQDYSNDQVEQFLKVSGRFKESGFKVLSHIASSASCLIMDTSRFDLVRLGISQYGFWPSQATRISYLQIQSEVAELVPALSWYTRISSVKEVPAGKFIGYGCSYRTNRQTKVAVLPVGYYEGYPRIAGDHGSYVLIAGSRCPILGRVCMNMLMVDVTHIQAKIGDLVTLIGKDQSEQILAVDLAAWSQTIHYELVTRLNSAIPRKLIAGD